MKGYYKKINSGLTLIESLIYIGIISLVVSGFMSYSLTVSDNREKIFVISEVNANSRSAVDLISRKVLGAESINMTESVFATDPGLLYLNYTEASNNPTIITLDADDGSLIMKVGTSSTSTITSSFVNVSDLTFTKLTKAGSNDTVRINLQIDYDNDSGDVIYNYSQDIQTTVTLPR